MTVAEKVAYYNNSGKEAEREIERRRGGKRQWINYPKVLFSCPAFGYGYPQPIFPVNFSSTAVG